MARIISINEARGKFKVLFWDTANLPQEEACQIVQRCGTVSYQSWGNTKKTPEEFVEMIKKMGHWSVLEYPWYNLVIKPHFKLDSYRQLIETMSVLQLLNPLLVITPRFDSGEVFVSGNVRMWREMILNANYWRSKIEKDERYPWVILGLTKDIYKFLNQSNPIFFNDLHLNGIKLPNIIPFDVSYGKSSNIEEILYHQVVVVLFSNVSRGLTHEFVRHRKASFTQESTRRVNESGNNFGFVMPPINTNQLLMIQVGEEDFLTTPLSMTQLLERFYEALIKSGVRKDYARQFLPIGLANQIVVAATLREWKHFFVLRCGEPAHLEIRVVAVELLKKFQGHFPQIFEDFKFGLRKDGSPYAVYVEDEDPMLL